MRRGQIVYLAQGAITKAQWALEGAIDDITNEVKDPNDRGPIVVGDVELSPITKKIIISTLQIGASTLKGLRDTIRTVTHCNKCNDIGKVFIPACSFCKIEEETRKFVSHPKCDAQGTYIRCSECNPGNQL